MLTLASLLAGGHTNIFLQQIEIGITTGAMYALVALGYTLVYGIIELINFAHGDVFMWSTVIIFLVVQRLGISSPPGGLALVGLLLLLLVIGMAVSAFLNWGIERVAYRRLRKAPRLAPLIAAIGASFILQTVMELWQGPNFTAFPTIFPTGSFLIFGARVTYLDIFIVLLAVALMYGLSRFINTSKLGRAMRATAQDPEAAALMGVNINQTIALTFLLGGALAGAAGLVYDMYIGQVWFLTGFQLGLIAFTAAVLGGIGNIYGAVLGGFLIGLIDSLSIQYLPDGFAWSLAVVFAILVLILVFRPSGLLGQRVPDKV
jgi:branched-chain amino acid transport system permease protein